MAAVVAADTDRPPNIMSKKMERVIILMLLAITQTTCQLFPSSLVPMPIPPEQPSLPFQPFNSPYMSDFTRYKRHDSNSVNDASHNSLTHLPITATPDTFDGPIALIAKANEPIAAQTSDCALILRRTLVRKNSLRSRAPDLLQFKNNPFDRQSKSFFATGESALQDICIRYIDVDLAIENAKRRRQYVHPEGLNSMAPPQASIDSTGELAIMTTHILAERFKLSPDEILNGLPMIDMSRTRMWQECPDHVKPVPCTMERYRTYTGHCNNMKHPNWGAAYTPFVRYLPPVYANGMDAPRVSVVDGSPLPTPRLITSHVHAEQDQPQGVLSILIMSWGQFIDHDLTLAAPPKDENGDDFDCCAMEESQRHPNCMPMMIPEDDKFYSRFSRTCMDFKRSIAGQRPNCALGPRVHVNTLTSAIDANFVYGSDETLAHKLRSFSGGRLRVWDRFRDEGLKPLLPPESEHPERDCIARPRHLFCFIAGDERVNEQIHLTVLHTLYVRDHNRMAAELAQVNSHWDDERIYQEVRHIMAATVQHITLNEFLPLLLGQDLVERYNLTETEGYWDGYDPDVHFGPSHAFQSAAFRFGHTFIQSMVRRYNKWHEFIGEDPLRSLLRHPFVLYEPGKMDEFVGGLINTQAQSYDPFISGEVGNHLFEQPQDGYGLDLPALNLARGREHGVPGYNVWREWCGLPRAESFEDLEPVLQNRTAFKFSQLYKHVDDIDLWSGGIAEQKLPGAIVGPTFACIIARQFANIRRGDRFWFENSAFPSAFTPEQLAQIKRTTQAKIICENSDDIPTIQKWVLQMPHPVLNPRVQCSDLPSIDFRFWQEDPETGRFSY